MPFDPSQPFEVLDAPQKPAFDPSKPFDSVDESDTSADSSAGTADATSPLASTDDSAVLASSESSRSSVQSPPGAGLGDVAADNIAKRKAILALSADVWDKATGVGSIAWANQVLDKAKSEEEPLIKDELPYPDLRPSTPQEFSKTTSQKLGEDVNTAKEMVKSAAGGAASSVSDILGGAAGAVGDSAPINATIKAYSDRISELEKKKMPNLDGISEEQALQIPSRDDTLTFSEVQELAQKRAIVDYLSGKKQASGLNDIEDFRKLTSAVSKEAQTYFGQDPKRQEEFLNKLGQGAGSLPAYVAAGMSGTPALAMIVGGLQTAQNEYNAAIDAGRPDLADKAYEKGLYIGMTEAVGVGGGSGKAAEGFSKKVAQFALKGLEEGGQEFVQQTLQNLNANTFTGYNPDQGTFEGATEAGLIGFILGGGTEAIHQTVASPETKRVAETLTNEAAASQSESPLAAAEAEKFAAELVAKEAMQREVQNRITEEHNRKSSSEQTNPETTADQPAEARIPAAATSEQIQPSPAEAATEPPVAEPAPQESVAETATTEVPQTAAEEISSPETTQPQEQVNPAPSSELPEPTQDYSERQPSSDVTDEQVTEARTILDGALPQDSIAKMSKLAGVNIVDDADSPSIVTDDRGTTINIRKLAANLSKLDGDAKASYVVNSLDEALTHQATRKAVTASELDGIGKSLTSDERDTVERLYGSKMSDTEAAAEAIRLFIQGAKGEPTEAFNLFTQKAKNDPGFRAAVARVLEYVRELASNIGNGSLSTKLTDGIERTQKVLDDLEKSVASPGATTIAENANTSTERSSAKSSEAARSAAHERAYALAQRIAEEVAKGQPDSVKEAAFFAAYTNASGSIDAGPPHQFNPAFMRKSAARAAGRAAENQPLSLDAEQGEEGRTLLDEQAFDGMSPEEQTAANEIRELSDRILSSLTKREQDIFKRLIDNRETPKEIANDLGISRQAVEKIQKSTMDKIAKRLAEYEATGELPASIQQQLNGVPEASSQEQVQPEPPAQEPQQSSVESAPSEAAPEVAAESQVASEQTAETAAQTTEQPEDVSSEPSTESTETPLPVEPPSETPAEEAIPISEESPAIETADEPQSDVDLPPTPPVDAAPELPQESPSSDTTAAYNSATDKLLAESGLAPIEGPAKKALGVSWDQALQEAAAAPEKGSLLVDEINQNPRNLKDDVEAGILLKEIADRKLRQSRAQQAVIAASENGTKEEVDAAKQNLDKARTDVLNAITAAKLTGTAWGRTGRFRQIHIDQDFSLAAMEAAWRSEANDGKPLSETQQKTIAELHQRIASAEKKIADLEAKQAEFETNRVFDEVLNEARTEAKSVKKTGKPSGSLTDFLSKQADKARKRIIERRGKLFATVDPLNLAGLADHIIIGADYIAKGLKEFGAWSSKMIEDFGNSIEPALPEVFKRSTAFHDDIQAEMAPKGPATPEQVLNSIDPAQPISQKAVFDLVRAHVNAGLDGVDEVMAATLKDLQTKYPDLTMRDVKEAFTKYGQVTYPSREEDLTKVREIKNISRLQLQLEDALSGKPPKKTGPQRDAPSLDVRTLIRQVREAMRASGIEATTPEQQLKTSLETVKTRLRNRIEELKKQIASRKKPEGKTQIPYDEEAIALRTERHRLSAISEEIFGKTELTDEQRVNSALKSLDRAIAEEDQMFKEGILKRPKNASKTPITNEIEAKRSLLDAMRQMRREIADNQNPKADPEQKALEAAKKAAQKSIERYDEMLKSGNLDPAERQKRFNPTTELEALWSERNAMKDAVSELRAQSRPGSSPDERARKSALKALDKRLAQLDERIKSGDFSTQAKPEGKASKFADVISRRAEVKAVRELFNELKKAQLPKRTKEEIDLARAKKVIQNRLDALNQKIANKDYSEKVRTPPATDAEKQRLQYEYEEAKTKYLRDKFDASQPQWVKGQKAAYVMDKVGKISNFRRALITGAELSGILRQGGMLVKGGPINAIKTFGQAFEAFTSKEGEFNVNERIRKSPNALAAKRAELFLTDERATDAKQIEEQAQSKWAEKIPWFSHTQRFYTSFLNQLRQNIFDMDYQALKDHHYPAEPPLNDVKLIAHNINVMSGRGKLPASWQGGANLVNSLAFAARFVASRLQAATLQPLWGAESRNASWYARGLVGKRYARFVLGYAAQQLVSLILQDYEDRKKDPAFWDPRGSKFQKVKVGNTYLDLLSGLGTGITLLARLASGEVRTGSDKIIPIRGEGSGKFGNPDVWKVLTDFASQKLAPNIRSALDLYNQKDFNGKPLDWTWYAKQATPITAWDIASALEAEGVPRGSALAIALFFGEGVSQYQKKK